MFVSSTSPRTILSTSSNRFIPLASPPLASYSATLVMPSHRMFSLRFLLTSAISSWERPEGSVGEYIVRGGCVRARVVLFSLRLHQENASNQRTF